jgi:uncharacterized membrane protein YhaH (DUF805 family)
MTNSRTQCRDFLSVQLLNLCLVQLCAILLNVILTSVILWIVVAPFYLIAILFSNDIFLKKILFCVKVALSRTDFNLWTEKKL